MKEFTKKQFFTLLLLCSCGEINNTPKEKSSLDNTTAVVSPNKHLALTISQQTQQACSADNVTLWQDHLHTLRQTIKHLITQAGAPASQQPWRCAVSLADDIQNHLQQQPSPPKGGRYDLVVIGAGTQASIFNAALWEKIDQQNSNFNVLFIDQNPDGGAQHFRTYIYRINTGATGTSFPPAPLQINEYAAENSPPAYSIWTQAAISHFLSRSHFVFGKHVQSVELMRDDADNHLYKILTEDMPSVYTPTVVIATGLGNPKFPKESDPVWLAQQHQQATACQALPCIPNVLTFEDMVLLERHLNANSKSLLSAWNNQSVAILGNGPSGQAAKQFLTGQAHPHAYQHAAPYDRPRQVQQFSGHINEKITHLGQTATGSIALRNARGDKYLFDNVIVAIGYDRKTKLQRLIGNLINNTNEKKPNFATVSNKESDPIAYQLRKSINSLHQVFIIGPASEAVGQGKSLGDVISASGETTTQFAHWLAPQLVH